MDEDEDYVEDLPSNVVDIIITGEVSFLSGMIAPRHM